MKNINFLVSFLLVFSFSLSAQTTNKEVEDYFTVFLNKNNDDLYELFLQHQPSLIDCKKVFTDSYYKTAFENFNKGFAEMASEMELQGDRFKNKTACKATKFNTDDVISNTCNVCPSRMTRIAENFKPNIECFSVVFLNSPESESGTRFTFFTKIGDRWVLMPMN